MSLASVCNSLAVLVGVQPATTWAGNTDVSAVEMVAWVNEAQARVADEFDWQALLQDASADLTGGAVEWVLALPSDCQRVVPDTLWLTGQRRRVAGPLSTAEWQQRRYQAADVPVFTLADGYLQLRTFGGSGSLALTTGTITAGFPTTGDALALRYVVELPALTADNQVTALGAKLERTVLLCAVALYRDAKGLPSASAASQYTSALSQAKARDMPVGVLAMAGRGRPAPAAEGRPGFTLDQSYMT